MAGPFRASQDDYHRQTYGSPGSRYHPARLAEQKEADYDFARGVAVGGGERNFTGYRRQQQQSQPGQLSDGYESQPLYREYTGESEHNSKQQPAGYNGFGENSDGDYHAAGAESDISLPLYRSRSQSILEASQNLLPTSNSSATAPKSGTRAWPDMPSSLLQTSQRQATEAASVQAQQQPSIRAVDFQTGQRFDNASSTPSQLQASSGQPATAQSQHSSKSRHVDFAASVTQALNDFQEKAQEPEQEKPFQRPAFERTNSDWEMDDEHNTTFDDYDWSDDDELVRQLDERYEREYKEQIGAAGFRRATVIRKFSPVQ